MKSFLNRFLDVKAARGISEGEISNYKRILTHFRNWVALSGKNNLRAVTKQDIVGYIRAIQPSLSPVTVYGRIGKIRQLFGYLAAHGLVLVDPCKDMIPRRCPKGLPRGVLSETEALKILELPDTNTPFGIRMRSILEVLYGTGIRSSELTQLEVHHVDLQERTLFIKEGKGKKDRFVPLGRHSSEWLQRYISEVRTRFFRANTSAVYVVRGGRSCSQDAIQAMFRMLNRDPRCPAKVGPHILRHTCAVHLLRGGASIRHIQKLLGHASIQTTQIYTRLVKADLKAVYGRYVPRDRMKIRFDILP